MKFNKKAFIEALKELVRVAFLGALSAGLSWLTTQVGNLDPTTTYAIVGAVVLKVLDKYIHKADNIPVKGISPI